MSLTKRTYALPPDMLIRFEKAVPAGERGRLLAGLLREWLNGRERERIRRDVIEGCREMRDVYLAVEREYHPLEEEAQRVMDSVAAPRRRRRRPSRPR